MRIDEGYRGWCERVAGSDDESEANGIGEVNGAEKGRGGRLTYNEYARPHLRKTARATAFGESELCVDVGWNSFVVKAIRKGTVGCGRTSWSRFNERTGRRTVDRLLRRVSRSCHWRRSDIEMFRLSLAGPKQTDNRQ